MHGDVARADHAPPALGLHAAKTGAHARHRVGHAARVRDGIKTIRSRHGPDAHRLKENIKPRISRHNAPASQRKIEYIQLRGSRTLFIDRSTVPARGMASVRSRTSAGVAVTDRSASAATEGHSD